MTAELETLAEIAEYNRLKSILQKTTNDIGTTNTIETSEFRRDIIEMVAMIDRKIKILKSEYSEATYCLGDK